MRVGLFITCLADALFPDVAKASYRLLTRLGYDVDVPLAQTCCGQMHLNTGYREQVPSLARRHVETFAGYDAVVAPSGSCVGTVRHQHLPELERSGPAQLLRTATDLVSRTYELSEFLVDVHGSSDLGAYYPRRVTYHPTCHSLRVLRVGDRPLRLLRAVEGLDLVPLPEAETCCGFGGTFSVKNSDVSSAMLEDKVRSVRATGAEVVTAGDASCLMHIGGGLARADSGVDGVHLAEVLASTRQEPSRRLHEVAR